MSEVAAIQQKLAEAATAIDGLNDAYADAAYQASIGEGTEEAAAIARGAYRVAVDRVADLERALKRAKEEEERRILAARAEVHVEQLKAVEQAIGARDRHFAELISHLTAAIKSYKSAIRAGELASRAIPGGNPVHDEGMLTRDRMNARVQNEIYRLSADMIAVDPTAGARFCFPGGSPDTGMHANQPEKIEPAIDTLKRAGAFLLDVLHGRKPLPLPSEESAVDNRQSAGDPLLNVPAAEESGMRADPNAIKGQESLLPSQAAELGLVPDGAGGWAPMVDPNAGHPLAGPKKRRMA